MIMSADQLEERCRKRKRQFLIDGAKVTWWLDAYDDVVKVNIREKWHVERE